MPNLDEFIECIQDTKYFCVLNIKRALHNVEIEERSKHLIGFVMMDGCYHFERLTFNFKNVPAHFQRLI